jgi:ribonucleotide monophosphatase NagD (HAD superfamily)
MLEDASVPHAKERLLEAYCTKAGFSRRDVLVVGDRPDGEIAAAVRLGMRALRVRGGEFGARATPDGVPEADDVRAVLSFFSAAATSER